MLGNGDVERVVREQWRGLFAFVRNRVASAEDAADVVQDTLACFARRVRQGGVARATYGSYLRAIARNEVCKLYQTRGLMPDPDPSAEAAPSPTPDLASDFALREAVADLPGDAQQVIRLRMQGWTVRETARALGVSRARAHRIEMRGQAQLRRSLSAAFFREPGAAAGGLM